MTSINIENWFQRPGQTVEETKAILSTSRATIWRRIKSGDLQTFRVGPRAIRVKTDSILKLVNGDASSQSEAA